MLLPLLLLSILSVSITVQRHSEARAAESVAEDAENLGELLDRVGVAAQDSWESITTDIEEVVAKIERKLGAGSD